MAFKKMNIRPAYKKNSEYKPGEVIIDGGVYERIKEDNYGRNTHIFRLDDDSLKAVNHAGHLTYLLEEYANFGDYCRITYKGIAKIEASKKQKGKTNDPHTFDLEIDPDRFDPSFAKHRDASKPLPPKNETRVEEQPQAYSKHDSDDIDGVEL